MSHIPRINSLENYHTVYQESLQNPEGFWDKIAKTFTWQRPYSKVLNWDFEHVQVPKHV